MEGLSLADVYYPLATAFQWAIVALVLATRRADASAAAVAVILGGNGFETLHLALLARGVDALAAFVPFVDGLIVLTLPFLAARFPTPPGVGRARGLTAAWLAILLAWTLVALAYRATPGPALYLARAVPLALALVAAAALLALRLVPRAMREREGPLRAQSLLVGAGIAAGLAYSSGLLLATFASWLAAGGVGAAEVATQTGPALAFLLVAAALRASLARARDGLAFAAVVAGALALGLLDVWVLLPRYGILTNEFVTQSARPLLVAVALLRYDLFSVPKALRRPLVPVTLGLAVLSGFILLTVLFSRAGMGAATVDPVGAVGALAVVALGTYALRAPVAEIARSAREDDPAAARARLERYRLALERARASPGMDAASVETLRRELGVTRAESAALESVLDGNLVIPTAALVGASAGALVAGRYEVVRELGRGGFGRAHLAKDRATSGEVVLKEVARPWERDAEERRRALQREAAASARVDSPHVARVSGVIEEPWQTYLVREYVPGLTLEEEIRARGALPTQRAREIVDGVLAGLEALHAAGLLHLDVKPANVVVRADGVAVLIDQGAARAREPDAEDRTRAAGGAASPGSDALTPRWAAPEQIRGARVDRATDVYGAGVLLYHALTAASPAPDAGRFEVERAIVEGRALAWPEETRVDPAIRAVVSRATARDPSERYPDAAAMRADLAIAALAAATVRDKR